jgi:hypothetical protein
MNRVKAAIVALSLALFLMGCKPEPHYADCAAARAEGAAPITSGQPGYRSGLDRDGNGVACEDGS